MARMESDPIIHDCEAFEGWLRGKGLKQKTLDNYVDCLNRLSRELEIEIGPATIGGREDAGNVADRLKDKDGKDSRACRTAAGRYADFVQAMKDDNPEFRKRFGGKEIEHFDADPGLDSIADELLLDLDFLEKTRILLEDKRQVIFQGPPGTGKTYVAQKLAECLAGSPDRVTIVQFHPSYAYEDFVQGFRPTLDQGQAVFKLSEGPLLKAAKRAKKESDTKHFLIIDEINRGNLAKVFGELYFLLEYRDKKIRLQYEPKTFGLPANLYIIGTMNTADRSIALVDLALRRRFYFVSFDPHEPPVAGLLGRWLAEKAPGMEWVADAVAKANELLDSRHAAIGPSYFMKEGLDEDAVERIWKHSVMPYIEEHLFGEPERLEELELERLRNQSSEDEGDGAPADDAAGPDDGE